MLFEGALNFKWPDAIPGADNDIIGPANEPIITLFILVGAISRNIPVAAQTCLCRIGGAPVFFEDPGWTIRLDANGDISFFACGQLVAFMIDDADLKARRGLAH